MDTAQAVVDEFAGKPFAEILVTLIDRCTYTSWELVPFVKTLEHLEAIHRAAGVEFNRQAYWNEDIIFGSHPVLPPEVASVFDVPEEVTVEYLDRIIGIFQASDTNEAEVRRVYDDSRSGRRRVTTGSIDNNILNHSISVAPVFVNVSADDDSDDFL